MTRTKLASCTSKAKQGTKDALQMVYDTLNKGQRQKLLKDPQVLALLQHYGVEIEE